MTSPAPAWDLVRVYGTWVGMDGSLRAGTYKITLPARVTDQSDDLIVPAGLFASGSLQTAVSGSPSLDIMVPATDDPDIQQTGWKVIVAITFSDGAAAETYTIDVPYADRPSGSGGTGLGVNLRTIALSATVPQTDALYRVGVAGGLAQLNSSGQVIDADGNPVTGGGSDPATATHAATSKTTPVDADEIPLADSASTFTLKKLTWANLKATIKSYLDGTGVAKLTTARTINGVSFDGTANITVADSTKVPTTTTVNGHALSGNVTVTAADVSAVPTTRTVAGHALSADVTLAKADVGLGSVDNTADAAKAVLSATKLTTARTIAGHSFDGTANISISNSDVGAMGYCVESAGTYPSRPASTAPVTFIGPDAPAGGGTTAGGAGAVNGLDIWFQTAS